MTREQAISKLGIFDQASDPGPALHAAAFAGDRKRVVELLKGGVDPDERNESGATALHVAAAMDHKDVAQVLINAGAHVDSLTTKGKEVTPLAVAVLVEAALGSDAASATMRLLLASKANPNFPSGDDTSPTSIALFITNGEKLLDWLLSNGGKIKDSFSVPGKSYRAPSNFILAHLLATGSAPDDFTNAHLTRHLKALARHGIDLDSNDGPKGRTVLQHVIAVGYRPGILKAIVDAGADPNAKSKAGMTALMYACQAKNAPALKELLETGADVDAKGEKGVTALMIAANVPSYSCAEALLEAGANVSAKDDSGKTALDHAAEKRISSAIRSYEKGGSKRSSAKDPAATAKLIAAIENNDDEKGAEAASNPKADVDAVFSDGDVPIVSATKKGMSKTVKKILDAGGDPNAVDGASGLTALHWAVWNNDLANVVTLMDGAADPSVKSPKKGLTPLHYAAGLESGGSSTVLEAILAYPKGKKAIDVRAETKNPTPLLHASAQINPETGLVLVRSGADVAARNEYGQTPLYLAAKHGNADLVEALLSAGADPEAEDGAGRSVLQVAVGNASRKMVLEAIAAKQRLKKR